MKNKRIKIEIISADVAGILNRLNRSGTVILSTELIDDLTVHITVDRKKLHLTQSVLRKESAEHKIISPFIRENVFRRILRRPILWSGICAITILTLFLQGRVLFVRVAGNRITPANMIIDCANQCGISFGSSVADLRNEKIKNALIQRIDCLKWVGIEVKGCVVTIHVQEDQIPKEQFVPTSEVSHIIAVRDGLITDITTTNGQPQCEVGQAVREGQILISGYTDYGKVIKCCRADGEIFARTQRTIELVTPDNYSYRKSAECTSVHYSVKIGNKLINLSSDSGISPADCVKIYKEKPWTLPDGYVLPVTWIVETWISFENDSQFLVDRTDHGWMKDYARDYLRKKMIAGNMIMEEFDFTCSSFGCRMEAKYLCEEMIGRSVDLLSDR